MRENRSLTAAVARLRAAVELAHISGAATQPTLDASLSVSRAKSLVQGRTPTTSLYALGLSASYEVDLWQKLSAREQAALTDVAVAEDEAAGIALLLSVAAANTYYSVQEQHGQLALLERQAEVNRQLLQVIEARFANGGATAVDVFQQREQLASVAAQVPPARARLATSEHLLATLTGQAPRLAWVTPSDAPPELAELPALGLPAELLEHRPDVRAARARIVAQDHRLGAALADRYPSLRLSASSGDQATAVGDFFSHWLWSLAGNLLEPVLDGGRRKAEVARNRAVLEQLVATYEQSVLDGLREVENSLVQEREQRELNTRLRAQYELAQSAYEAGRARYLAGVGNFLTVLTELQAVQRIERALLSARFGLVTNRVALHQALGGFIPPESFSLHAPLAGAAE